MTIPKGATHVDSEGDFWKVSDGKAYAFDEDMGYFPRNCIGHTFDDAHYKWNLQPIRPSQPYKGQFEPWQPGRWPLQEKRSLKTASSGLFAVIAIEKAMRC